MSVPDRIVFRMGKRIYLRPVLKEDLPQITIWINDPEVTQFLKASYPLTPQDEEEWFTSLAERRQTNVQVALVLKETDEIIGTMGLHGINHRNGTAVTGAMIGNKKYWGKGYGTEAKMILLEYAFNTLNLRKICSNVLETNPRSKRALEKAGYKQEGCLKEQVFRMGRYIDLFEMAVFKEDFFPLWKIYKKDVLDKQD